jgi:hypothetical protein
LAVELTVEDKIDYKKLRAVANGGREIRVGHFDASKAEIGKKMYFGGMTDSYESKHGHGMMPGQMVPPRPYLTDGFLRDASGVEEGAKRFYEGLFVGRGGAMAKQLADKIATDIQSFIIEDNYYADILPNAEAVIADKGSNHPLLDSGDLAKSIKGKVVKGSGDE